MTKTLAIGPEYGLLNVATCVWEKGLTQVINGNVVHGTALPPIGLWL
jgi:hypothetical protein